jgi:uncharacterized membrane protein YbhN (UPF0104 family)
LSFITKQLTARKSFFFMIIGLTVFVLYLYFFVGFSQLFLVVKSVNLEQYLIFYFLAIGTMLLVMLFWVASWKTLLKSLNVKISLKNAFLYYWSGYFVDLVVPCQSVCGGITRLYLVQKETQKNYGAIAAAGVANRIVAHSIVTGGLTTGLFYLFFRATIPAFALGLLSISWIGRLFSFQFSFFGVEREGRRKNRFVYA